MNWNSWSCNWSFAAPKRVLEISTYLVYVIRMCDVLKTINSSRPTYISQRAGCKICWHFNQRAVTTVIRQTKLSVRKLCLHSLYNHEEAMYQSANQFCFGFVYLLSSLCWFCCYFSIKGFSKLIISPNFLSSPDKLCTWGNNLTAEDNILY